MQTVKVTRGPGEKRTNDNICADHQRFISSGEKRKQAQHYHNAVDDPLPLACIPIAQVLKTPVPLHVRFRIIASVK